MVRVTPYEKDEWFELALLGGFPSMAAWLRDCVDVWKITHLGDRYADAGALEVRPEAMRGGREDFSFDD